MKKIFLIVGFALAGSLIPHRSFAASFNGLYAFGDSLIDTGNVFTATGGAIPPAAVSLPGIPAPIPLYYEGRFSNGPIWLDYLAADLGLTPKPVTQLSGSLALPKDGVNFAYGGATTGNINVLDPLLPMPNLLGLKEQVSLFDTLIPDGEVADANALYVIWAGSNDYLPSTTAGPGFTPATTPEVPVANLSSAIQSIFAQGGRNFLIANLTDLGKTPFILQDPDLVGSSDTLNQRVDGFNSALNTELDRLNRSLPGIGIQLFDANALLDKALAGEFGFLNQTEPCLNQRAVTLCGKPDDYLFWDFNHPSGRAHRLLGEAAIATVHPPTPTSVPEPATLLGLLIFGRLGLISRRCQQVDTRSN